MKTTPDKHKNMHHLTTIYLCTILITIMTGILFYKSLLDSTWILSIEGIEGDKTDQSGLNRSSNEERTKCLLEPEGWSLNNLSFLPDYLARTDQEDPRLIEHIKDCWLIPPNNKLRQLKNLNITDYSQVRNSIYIYIYSIYILYLITDIINTMRVVS